MKMPFFIVILLLTLHSCFREEKKTLDSFHGYWKMHGFWQKDSTLKWKEAKWMKEGNGYLIYDGIGHMSIHITPKNYELKDSSITQKELFMEKPEIYTLANYAYSGTYKTNGKDSITHYRLSHGNPLYNLSTTKKRYEISKDTLFLYSTVAQMDCKIKWIRVQ